MVKISRSEQCRINGKKSKGPLNRYRGCMRQDKPDVFAERFWSRVEKQENGCWKWIGAKFHRGYGRVNSGGKMLRANRVAYEISKGDIPVGMVVCHKCDVPLCVNPDHLFLGTIKDNVDDMIRKGRKNSERGEDRHCAKLTEDII